MNNGEQSRQEARKNTRPPEYIIIHRQSSTRTGAQHPPQPKKTRQSTREAQLEERLSRREQLREQRYAARLRKQWVLAIVLVVVLLAFIVLARCNT